MNTPTKTTIDVTDAFTERYFIDVDDHAGTVTAFEYDDEGFMVLLGTDAECENPF